MATSVSVEAKPVLASFLVEQRKLVDDFAEEEKKAISGSTCPGVDAANDVGLAVDNARAAWGMSGLLQKKVEEIADGTFKSQLRELGVLVEDLRSRELTKRVNLQSRVLAFIRSFGLNSSQPEMLGLRHRYVYWVKEPTAAGAVETGCIPVIFAGKCRWVGQNQGGYALQLKPPQQGRETHEGATETTLSFMLRNLPKETGEQVLKNCQFIEATLDVQFNSGWKYWKTIQKVTYKFYIGIFPRSPGKLKLTCPVETRTGSEVVSSRSGTLTLTREMFPDAEGPVTDLHLISPHKDWKIKTADPKPQLFINGTAADIDLQNGCIPLSVTLNPQDAKAEGYAVFSEEKDIIQRVDHVQELTLQWGESHKFLAEKFKVELESFDGKKVNLEQPGDAPYLRIAQVGNEYILTAVPPQLV